MTQFVKMCSGKPACVDVIHSDARQRTACLNVLPHTQHERRATLSDLSEFAGADIGVHHDHAGGERTGDLVEIRASDGWVVVRVAHQQKIATPSRRCFGFQHELRIKRVRDIGQHQRKRGRASLGQRARREVGAVTEFSHGRHDAFDGARLHFLRIA